jgi:hypothetical protein
VDASEGGAIRTPADRVDQDQTLLEELVWSVVLIGGVVAYLLLVVKFPAPSRCEAVALGPPPVSPL